jgi:hypothetical protein
MRMWRLSLRAVRAPCGVCCVCDSHDSHSHLKLSLSPIGALDLSRLSIGRCTSSEDRPDTLEILRRNTGSFTCRSRPVTVSVRIYIYALILITYLGDAYASLL